MISRHRRHMDDFDRLQEWQEFQRSCATDNRTRKLDPKLRLAGMIVVGIALVIVAAILGIANGWQPGDQAGIAERYHAQRHEAAWVRMQEPEKPSVEVAAR